MKCRPMFVFLGSLFFFQLRPRLLLSIGLTHVSRPIAVLTRDKIRQLRWCWHEVCYNRWKSAVWASNRQRGWHAKLGGRRGAPYKSSGVVLLRPDSVDSCRERCNRRRHSRHSVPTSSKTAVPDPGHRQPVLRCHHITGHHRRRRTLSYPLRRDFTESCRGAVSLRTSQRYFRDYSWWWARQQLESFRPSVRCFVFCDVLFSHLPCCAVPTT